MEEPTQLLAGSFTHTRHGCQGFLWASSVSFLPTPEEEGHFFLCCPLIASIFIVAVGSKIIIKSEDARGEDGSLRRNEKSKMNFLEEWKTEGY